MCKIQGAALTMLLGLFLVRCAHRETIYLYSTDKSQCITIISEHDVRYIIDGKHDEVPDTNFIKLDITDIEPLADTFHVCWNNQNFEWDAVVRGSIVIESRLDSIRFNFNSKLPTDERGIPDETKFRMEGCAIYSFDMKRLSPNTGAIVESK